MNCPRCGNPINNDTTVCPACGLIFNNRDDNAGSPNNNNKKSFFGIAAPTKGAKSFAAIFTAILFCPALFCTVIDYVLFPNSSWSGYVVGALAVIWCFFVLPVLRIMPTVLNVLICFISMTLYGLYIAKALGIIGAYVAYAIPICIVICILFTITCAAIKSGKAKGFHLPALLLAQTAIFLISVETICEFQAFGAVRLGWSLIWMAILVSLAVICEAIAYASNGKK